MTTRPFRHTMNGTNGVAVHSPVSSGWPALPLFHSHNLPKKTRAKSRLFSQTHCYIGQNISRGTVTLDKIYMLTKIEVFPCLPTISRA